MWKRTQELLERLEREAELGERCIYSRDRATRRLLNRLVEKGLLVSVGGLYARASTWERLNPPERAFMRMRALAELHPYWVFCGSSAALVHGLWISWDALDVIHVAVRRDKASGNTGDLVVRHKKDEVKATVANGLRVTTFEQTVVDCLCQLDFVCGLPIADSALRMGGMTREGLLELVDELAFAHVGVVQARKTASWADARSESGGESMARARMVSLGYMLPDLQVWVNDPVDPSRRYRVDFGFDLGGAYVAGEFDGSGKYTDPALTRGADPERVRQYERRREARISAKGIRVMRFSYAEMLDDDYFPRLLDAYGIPRERPSRNVSARRAPVSYRPKSRPLVFSTGGCLLICSSCRLAGWPNASGGAK